MIRILTWTVFVLALAAASSVSARTDWQPFDQKAFGSGVWSGTSVVLEFHADSCPVCKAQAPILADLIKTDTAKMKGPVAFKANYDSEAMRRSSLASRSSRD